MKSPKVLVVCKDPQGTSETESYQIIKDHGFDALYSWKNTLSQKELKDIDLVIAIGGDGTVLSASHYLLEKPLLAVNSSPTTSVGALTTIKIEELKSKLSQIKKGKTKQEKLERIEILINDAPIDHLSLNEVFIGNEKPYHMSKYKISFGKKEETQRSSGLIFSTGTGSTAWFKSAGGSPFPKDSKFIKMIVREPYEEKPSLSYLKNSEIKEKEEIKITVLGQSILAVDSIREYKLNANDTITLKISPHPLNRII